MKVVRTKPTVTIIAVEIANAVEPAAKAVHGLILVERAKSKRASLSVSSATKIAGAIVANAPRRVEASKIAKEFFCHFYSCHSICSY